MVEPRSPCQSLDNTACRRAAQEGCRREGRHGKIRSPAFVSESIAPIDRQHKWRCEEEQGVIVLLWAGGDCAEGARRHGHAYSTPNAGYIVTRKHSQCYGTGGPVDYCTFSTHIYENPTPLPQPFESRPAKTRTKRLQQINSCQ